MNYTEPLLSVVFVLGSIGALRLSKGRGRNWVLVSLALLLAISWPPMEWLWSRPLEVWYPDRAMPAAPADAIVVLSSGVEPARYDRPFALAGHDTYSRCRSAAWLYQHWKPLPVLACGGAAKANGAAFANAMREVLAHEGVPDSSIWMEERSRTTYENALYGAEILRSHGIGRIALVVEAQSMPRAAACFRKLGIVVVPAPSEFRQWGPWSDEMPLSWKAIRRNEVTLHEIVGLAWYKLRGRI